MERPFERRKRDDDPRRVETRSFDPFLILGVDKSAEVADIRRAYRKLSLEFHPDKNLGNKGAEEMFMKVAKAYDAASEKSPRLGRVGWRLSVRAFFGRSSALCEIACGCVPRLRRVV